MKASALIAALSISTPAVAGGIEAIDEAMKKIGPAWACGAPYEYREAIKGLRSAMQDAGLSTLIIEGGIKEVDRYVKSSQFAPDRDTITRNECTEKYGRP